MLDFQNSLRNCEHLEAMDLMKTKFQSWNGKLSWNVGQIILFGNQISSKLFHHLTNLRFLDLSYNQLIEIHATSFDALQSLENLYLADNRIESSSENFFSPLNSLEVLILNSNNIRTISIGAFNALCMLHKEAFENAIKLKHLNCGA